MSFVYWITNATNTYSKYVLRIDFLKQNNCTNAPKYFFIFTLSIMLKKLLVMLWRTLIINRPYCFETAKLINLKFVMDILKSIFLITNIPAGYIRQCHMQHTASQIQSASSDLQYKWNDVKQNVTTVNLLCVFVVSLLLITNFIAHLWYCLFTQQTKHNSIAPN